MLIVKLAIVLMEIQYNLATKNKTNKEVKNERIIYRQYYTMPRMPLKKARTFERSRAKMTTGEVKEACKSGRR